jgi:hypothetical protein
MALVEAPELMETVAVSLHRSFPCDYLGSKSELWFARRGKTRIPRSHNFCYQTALICSTAARSFDNNYPKPSTSNIEPNAGHIPNQARVTITSPFDLLHSGMDHECQS